MANMGARVVITSPGVQVRSRMSFGGDGAPQRAHNGRGQTMSQAATDAVRDPEPKTRFFSARTALIIALGGYIAVFALLLAASVRRTDGSLIYPVDDVYIHAAMARNLVQHGVWGVTRYGFSSSSSSPLFTLLLAAVFAVTGPSVWAPLALNFAAGLLVLICAWRFLRDRIGDARILLGALLAICFLTPLVPTAFTGMEHPLHILLAILFLGMVPPLLASERAPGALFLALTALLMLVRLEGAALVAGLALALAADRRWKHALLVLFSGAAPVAALSAIYLAKGWAWLPNSVLLKVYVPPSQFGWYVRATGALNRLGVFLNQKPHLAVLLFLLALALAGYRKLPRSEKAPVLSLLGMLAIVADLVFGGSGWYYRYEAYLVAMALFAIAYALPVTARIAQSRSRLVSFVVVTVLFLPLALRAVNAHRDVPPAGRNLYEQQYQMARFLNRFYSGAAVAANDIGAIDYYADVRCVDLYGLANPEVFAAKRAKTFSVETLRHVGEKNQVRVAILYDHWFPPGIPREWTRVERWRIRDNHYLGGDTVSFYAVRAEEREPLIAHLKEFAASLPPGVERLPEH